MWPSRSLRKQKQVGTMCSDRGGSAGYSWKLRTEPMGLPVMRASGRDCSFLQAGTKTVISLWPLSKNQSTASFIPRQENTSLFPWLKDYFRTLYTTKPKFNLIQI